MKKIISALLALLLCLSLIACSGETPVSTATDGEKQTVIDAANKCLNSAAFNDYLDLYASLFGEERSVPEITDALVYSCADFEGLAVEAIFFRVDANVAFMEGTTCVNNDHVIFAVNTVSGAVYDSITHGANLNAFNGTIRCDSEPGCGAKFTVVLHTSTSETK